MSISPPFSESTILSVGRIVLSIAREHQDALAGGGLSHSRIDRMETDIDSLEAAPTAKENDLTLRGKTEAKNEALDACYMWGRSLEQRLVDRFGDDSPEVERFPTSRFSEAVDKENEMMMVMPTLFSLIDELEANLDGDGDLADFRAEGAADLETLRNKELAQELFKVDMGTQARHRQVLRRRIYDTVNDINRTGRRVYRNDPEKRNLFRSRWPYKRPDGDSPPESPETGESPDQDE